jgi:hypothetical protein
MAFKLEQKVKTYGKSQVINNEPLDPQTIKKIKEAEVVDGAYGLSVCFTYISGNAAYVPVDRQMLNQPSVGDKVDVKKVRILTLEKGGLESYVATW